MPREQLVQSGSEMIGDAAQHVGEPSLRIDAVKFCRGDDTRFGLISRQEARMSRKFKA
jgi:hypothetical protein